MAPDTIPYELKRLIYDYVDLQTIKSLRQVSKSWASVGLEPLFLPTFFVKYHSRDVQRLIDIESAEATRFQAKKTIKKLIFQNSGWNSRYFRRIVCNRHEHRGHYDAVNFVATQAEQEALDELDVIISQKEIDEKEERKESRLVSAMRGVPLVNSIAIETRNPFRNPILRKVWEEYALEAYRNLRSRQAQNQLLRVLSAAAQAGLPIRHFSHDQLLSSCFQNDDLIMNVKRCNLLQMVENLSLNISDLDGVFSADDQAVDRLRQLLSSFLTVEHLSVSFEALESLPLSILPTAETCKLKSLTISSISIEPIPFLSLLKDHASTLKRLRLRSGSISQGHGSWRVLLEDLRNMFGDKLEKFQVSGMLRSVDGDGEQWLLRPHYDDEWNVLPSEKTPRTREIEEFVLRGGLWPMVAADSIPFQLA